MSARSTSARSTTARSTTARSTTARSTPAKDTYHHGDLRAAVLTIAMGMLEAGEDFSLRAVARRAGVSSAAPYRHFADRNALESALAAEGFRDLQQDLIADRGLPGTTADLVELGVAYVGFALRRPALFRLMFGNECDDTDDERVAAAAELHELLAAALTRVFPDADVPALALACWGMVHGLACLHLDGKLPSNPADQVEDRIRVAFSAVLTARR